MLKGGAILSRTQKIKSITVFAVVVLVLLAGVIFFGGSGGHHGSIQAVMKDAVLHEDNKLSFLGLMEVNPGVISAYTVTVILLVAAALVRLLVIPKFKLVPGKLQLLLETAVGLFDGMARSNSPHRNKFLGVYLFSAGTYIFVGTLFELFGFQGVTTHAVPMALPAPLSDINAAIAMGCLSYAVIMSGGIAGNGIKGIGLTLKDFSLPISMSFRLFGALLSGLLVTELV